MGLTSKVYYIKKEKRSRGHHIILDTTQLTFAFITLLALQALMWILWTVLLSTPIFGGANNFFFFFLPFCLQFHTLNICFPLVHLDLKVATATIASDTAATALTPCSPSLVLSACPDP